MTMLGIRLSAETERGLNAISRRSRRPKSQIAREVIEKFVRSHDLALIEEARKQSLHAVDRRRGEEDDFWDSVAAADDPESPGASGAAV